MRVFSVSQDVPSRLGTRRWDPESGLTYGTGCRDRKRFWFRLCTHSCETTELTTARELLRAGLNDQHRAVLSGAVIGDVSPGPLLADLEMMIQALEPGVRTSSKHYSLPLSMLPSLNLAMQGPIIHDLNRPVLTSYPGVLGLFVLLRGSGLAVGEAKPQRTIYIDPVMRGLWDALSSTEKYLNMLSTWFFDASLECVGKRGRRGNIMRSAAIEAYAWLDESVTQVGEDHFGFRGMENSAALALLREFGWVKVEYAAPEQGKAAMIRKIERTEFGDAMFVATCANDAYYVYESSQFREIVRLTFPGWRNDLTIPDPEAREGQHVWKVSHSKTWRRLVAPSDSTLDDLASAILNAFDFSHDHLYEFILKTRAGKSQVFVGPSLDGEWFADEVPLGELPLEAGETMVFHYDFGDDWEFLVKLESSDEGICDNEIKVIESRGDSPMQYNWDDE